MPRIDSEAFSFMAWVQRDNPSAGGYILRKPLGKGAEKIYSCYGWHIGSFPSINFGAHDVGLPDQSVMEEVVAADGDWELDTSFHLEMIVVNKTSVRFYRDAQLRSELPLRRLVTDCSGSTFLVGDAGLQLAEITFYARSLTETEIQEIFFAGFTFESIAAGKIPYQPEETPFDRLLGAQDEAVSTLLTSQDDALAEAAVGRVLTQALIQQLQDSNAQAMPVASLPPDAGCAAEWPPCQVIRNVTDSLTPDSFTGHSYYQLVPPAARGGSDRFSVPLIPRQNMLQYDPATFPSWKGQSASLSVWIRPNSQGYIIAKSPDSVQNTMCWSVFVSETWGIGSLAEAPAADGSWIWPTNVIRWGGGLEANAGAKPPLTDQTKKLRHIAIVFNKDTNSMAAYVDGTLVADQPYAESDTVGRLDCDVTSDTYIGFAHRSPGGLPFIGEMQDFRMYVGTALTAEEVKGLSNGEDSAAERECSYSTEGQDTNYKDMNGNNCAWYQEAMAQTTAVCTAESVRTNCPVACGTQEACFEPPVEIPPTFQIWEKIMRLVPRIEGIGSLCVREGIDPMAMCMAAAARRDPLSFPPDGSPWTAKYPSLVEGGLGEPNITDCRLLYGLMEPTCSFKVPGEWTRTFDQTVQEGGSWTVSFWYKNGKSPEQLGQGIDLWMTFYSSIAPPIPALRIVSYFGILLFQTWGRPNCSPMWTEDVNMPVSYTPGQWVHVALTFGAPRGPQGQRHLQLVLDSVFEVDLLNREWCPPVAGEFIQALTVMHAHETLLSPISVTAQARSVKSLQLQYYETRPAFRLRRGPELPEMTRHARPVEYQRAQFDAAGALLAPPILLQRRLESSPDCAFTSGGEFKDKVWRDAVEGMTCGPPYLCDEPLLASASELITCRGDQQSATFLGRKPILVRGTPMFAEFLPSIADASILVRDGQLFETSNFIDTQTDEMTVSVALFAPNVGVLTLITVHATFTSRVHVGYQVEQFQAVENEALDHALTQAYVTYVFVALAVIELAIEGAASWREENWRHLRLVVMDIGILVIVPVVFLSLRIGQLKESAGIMSKVIGADGLGGVPWASTSIPLDQKMALFFEGLEELQDHFAGEQRMRVLAFMSVLFLLLRDDLWHFILLFLVLFLGYAGVAYVSFGNSNYEFHSLGITFETLFDMMLGSLPKHGGGGARKSWTSDPLLVIYVSTFNFLVFFVMLNFIIAIIVESYLYTKRRLEDELTEQEFLHDIVDSVRALCRRLLYRWPSHRTLIRGLKDSQEENVDENNLPAIFPDWDRGSISRFVDFYFDFHFLRPEEIPDMVKLEGKELVTEIENRVHHLLQGGEPHGKLRGIGGSTQHLTTQRSPHASPEPTEHAAGKAPTEGIFGHGGNRSSEDGHGSGSNGSNGESKGSNGNKSLVGGGRDVPGSSQSLGVSGDTGYLNSGSGIFGTTPPEELQQRAVGLA